MATQKQINANRRNAQKSTGPRTPEGKARVRFNALKHGMLAKSIILPGKENFESREEFDFLLQSLFDDLQPVGMIEQTLVEKVAVAYWRLQRALRAEAATIHDYCKFRRDIDPHLSADPGIPNDYDIRLQTRYEGPIERQFNRALDRLLDLQRRRHATDPTPPPTKKRNKPNSSKATPAQVLTDTPNNATPSDLNMAGHHAPNKPNSPQTTSPQPVTTPHTLDNTQKKREANMTSR